MIRRYLTVFNLQREKDWVLKNAYDIIETREINAVWSLEFSIPMNDEDMAHCLPNWFVRYGDDGQLYRLTDQTKTNSNESSVTYHCEHVIATLCDDVMFQGPYIKGNIGTYTEDVLKYILDMQTKIDGKQNWKLGECQPRRQFEYSWENENLLAALWSVPTCFDTPYMWTFDTSSYPWTLNLVEIHEDADPDFYLMAKKNILSSTEESSNLEICTRLYGLGEGEGVNQLTIKSVNNDCPYVQSSDEIIAKYGIVSRIFVDRRFQYPETLKARMESLLHELEKPTLKREFNIVDLYDLSPDDMYKAEVGKIVLLKDDNTKVYITKTEKNWSNPGDMKITIATKATDMSSSIADLADRQRIEQVYSQGASQVYSFSFFGNATDEFPLEGYVYFPEDLKYLNEVKLKVMLRPFRSYSKSALSNGGQSETITITSQEATVVSAESKEIKTIANANKDLDMKLSTKKVNTVSISKDSSAGGSINGSTSASTTGGGTINVSLSGTAVETGNENWANPSTISTSRTNINDYENYQTQTTLVENGSHSHGVTGSTSAISLDQDDIDNKSPHAHNLYSDYVSTTEKGSHVHTVNDNTGHTHGIGKDGLRHTHNVSINVTSNTQGQSGFSHSHTFSVGSHTHKIDHTHQIDLAHEHVYTLKGHTHKVTIPEHTHKVTVPEQTIPITIDPHSHDIEAGIFETGNPTSAVVTIDDNRNKRFTITDSDTETDITQLLLKNGTVPRGQWIKISVKPNNPKPDNLAYISVFGNTFAYIQSYTGGNY